jgi:hypothetical protein
VKKKSLRGEDEEEKVGWDAPLSERYECVWLLLDEYDLVQFI